MVLLTLYITINTPKLTFANIPNKHKQNLVPTHAALKRCGRSASSHCSDTLSQRPLRDHRVDVTSLLVNSRLTLAVLLQMEEPQMFWNQRKTACSSISVSSASCSCSSQPADGAVGSGPRPASSSSNIWDRLAGSGGGGANAGAGSAVRGGAGAGALIGPPVGCLSRAGGGTFGGTGSGTGASGSGGEEGAHPIFAQGAAVLVVMVAAGGGKTDTGEEGAHVRTPPRPRVGTGVKSPLYLAFSALESAFQR